LLLNIVIHQTVKEVGGHGEGKEGGYASSRETADLLERGARRFNFKERGKPRKKSGKKKNSSQEKKRSLSFPLGRNIRVKNRVNLTKTCLAREGEKKRGRTRNFQGRGGEKSL